MPNRKRPLLKWYNRKCYRRYIQCDIVKGVIYLLEKGAVVHPNVAFEDKEWPDIKIQEYGHQLNMLINYYNTHRGLPVISQFSHDLVEYASCIDNSQQQCEICGVGNGFQVFDVDGRSYPCHLLSPLVLHGDKLQQIRDGVITTVTNFADPRCSSCPYRLSCATCVGCNYIYRNRFNKRDITHCKIMQLEVKAYIKKEVLRLKSKSKLDSYDATLIDAIFKLQKSLPKSNEH